MTRRAILVVEDQAALRMALCDFLRGAFPDAALHEAGDAVEALEACAKIEPDVVLTDVQLPGSNGIDLTARIKERFPEMRVIVMSYRNSEAYVERALAAGAREFIPKERLDRQLIAALSSAIANAPR